MKNTRIAALIALALAASLGAQSAFAWHHGPRVSIGVGFGFGVPYAAYPYYYQPYYAPYYSPYYSAPVVVQEQPTVYVEQQPAPAAQPSAQPAAPAGYWYYCAGSRAYY